ncbi:MAG: transglutaminase-like putative cysteine protease [Porticoccaceae bacterium]
MPNYRVFHHSTYRFDNWATISSSRARLLPRDTPNQTTHFSQLVVVPPPTLKEDTTDLFGNRVTLFSYRSKLARLEVTSISTVEVRPSAYNVDDLAGISWQASVDAVRSNPSLSKECQAFLISTLLVDTDSKTICDYAAASSKAGQSVFDIVDDLMRRLKLDMAYVKGVTDVHTTAVAALNATQGVCQDFAHISIACLRSLGLATRYVCGYHATIKRRSEYEPHAWASVYVPQCGWLDFDPTNNCFCDARYITLAWGRDFMDVSPLQGAVDGDVVHTLEASVEIEELD